MIHEINYSRFLSVDFFLKKEHSGAMRLMKEGT